MAAIKRALRKTVGGYHAVTVDDEGFSEKDKKFRIYDEKLKALSKRAEEWSTQMLEFASATRIVAKTQQALVSTNPEHVMVKETGNVNKALDAYSKDNIQKLIQAFQKNVRTPLQQRMNEAMRIEEKLRQRQKFRNDYMYYQGKVEKLEETHQNNLKNGKVEKIAFTEMLERNHKKVDKSKDNFEQSSKALEKQLTVLLSTYQEAIRSITVEALDIQKTICTDFCQHFTKLSSFYHKVKREDEVKEIPDNKLVDIILGPYIVVHEDGAPVKESVTDGSLEFDCIKFGMQVNVVELIGTRARIDQPIHGWISIESASGEDVVAPKLPPKNSDNYFVPLDD